MTKTKEIFATEAMHSAIELLLAVLWLCSLFHTRHHVLVTCVAFLSKCMYNEH